MSEAYRKINEKFEIVDTEESLLGENREAAIESLIECVVPFVDNQLIIEMSLDDGLSLISEAPMNGPMQNIGAETAPKPEASQADKLGVNRVTNTLSTKQNDVGKTDDVTTKDAEIDVKDHQLDPVESLKEATALSVWFQALFNLTFSQSNIIKFKNKLSQWAGDKDKTLLDILQNKGGCLFNEAVRKSNPFSLLGTMMYSPNVWVHGSQENSAILVPLVPNQVAVTKVLEASEKALSDIKPIEVQQQDQQATGSEDMTQTSTQPIEPKVELTKESFSQFIDKYLVSRFMDGETFDKLSAGDADLLKKLRYSLFFSFLNSNDLSKFDDIVTDKALLDSIKADLKSKALPLAPFTSTDKTKNILANIFANIKVDEKPLLEKYGDTFYIPLSTNSIVAIRQQLEESGQTVVAESKTFSMMMNKYKLIVEDESDGVPDSKPVEPIDQSGISDIVTKLGSENKVVETPEFKALPFVGDFIEKNLDSIKDKQLYVVKNYVVGAGEKKIGSAPNFLVALLK